MFLQVLRSELRSRLLPVLWVIMSIGSAVIGPFGSYGAVDFWDRLLFWAPVTAVVLICAMVLRALIMGGLGLTSFSRGSLLIAFFLALLLSYPLRALLTATFAERVPVIPGLLEIAVLLFSLSLGICALRMSGERAAGQSGSAPGPAVSDAGTLTMALSAPAAARVPAGERAAGEHVEAGEPARHAVSAPAAQPRLLQRLDPPLRGELLSISVRDHYVDVRTTHGVASLLMRLSDAIAEAEPLDGAQVHRSHWVAWPAVSAVARDGARLVLCLTDGSRVPVSRQKRDAVAGRGLI